MPDQDSINRIKNIIQFAVTKLGINDYDICKLPDDTNESEYERILHEICINHRFALYIEEYVQQKINNNYKVDIEYNKNYYLRKEVQIKGKNGFKRPDIIVHTRTDKLNNVRQNFIIIEAKKNIESIQDKEKVKAFIEDFRYKYEFGITIVYNSLNPVKVKIFYLSGNTIESKDFEIKPEFLNDEIEFDLSSYISFDPLVKTILDASFLLEFLEEKSFVININGNTPINGSTFTIYK